MAYINKKDYNIVSSSNIDNYMENCFECDDMIAPVIQELNRKGYTTTFCCGGHPYIDHSEAICINPNLNPEDLFVGVESVEPMEDGNRLVTFNQWLTNGIYISFEEGKVPETLPDYVCREDNAIFIDFDYRGGEEYKFMGILLKYNRMLYKWAKGLGKIA